MSSTEQWKQWTDEVVSAMGQYADSSRLQALAARVPDGAPPALIPWAKFNGTYQVERFETDALTMLACVGDDCYALRFHDLVPIAKALGEDLIDRHGAKLPADLYHSVLSASWALGGIDALERMRLAQSWGSDARHRSQALMCLFHSHARHALHIKEIWKILADGGVLESSKNWTSCPMAEQVIVAALKDREPKRIKELRALGARMDWADPASGATLWHFAAVGGAAMSKALLPALQAECAGLAPLVSTSDAEFGEGSWSGQGSERTPWFVPKGSSALHLATRALDIPLARALLELGADPNLSNGSGERPLHMLARKHGAKAEASAAELVELLLARGADPALANAQGKTPLQALAAKAPLSAILKLLALRPEDFAGSNAQAREALATMAQRGSEGLSVVEDAILASTLGQAPASSDLGKRKPRL